MRKQEIVDMELNVNSLMEKSNKDLFSDIPNTKPRYVRPFTLSEHVLMENVVVSFISCLMVPLFLLILMMKNNCRNKSSTTQGASQSAKSAKCVQFESKRMEYFLEAKLIFKSCPWN